MMEKIPQIIHSSWHEHLQPLFDDPKMTLIKDSVLPAAKYYPEKRQIFNVFTMPIDTIKVVILGQDPYAKVGQATGLAFSVEKECPIPASLNIVMNEIKRSGAPMSPIGSRTLGHWVNQGVFLLNTALTVKAGDSGSHIKYWSWFTREVVKIISIYGNKPVWMMWGAKAKAYIGIINMYYKWRGDYKGSEYNYILEADHPAAETYPDSKGKFTGCNHFNICNDILHFKGQSKILW